MGWYFYGQFQNVKENEMPPLKDERSTGLIDYSGAVDKLNIIAKKELEEVQNQVLLENVNLSQLRQKIIQMQNEFQSWKKSETTKFNNEMNTIKNDILARQNEINLHVQQQSRITSDLQTQQTKFEGLNAERIKLKDEMVRLEGLKIQAQDMIKEAERIKAEALTEKNNITQMHLESLEGAERNKQENIRLVNLNDAIEKSRKEIEDKIKTHIDLKEYVEPKLRAIQEEKEALENAKEENQNVIDELNRKISEEKILFQSVVDKKEQLEKDLKAFESQKQEFAREKLLSPNKV
jgi:chromosome segregation ATPase